MYPATAHATACAALVTPLVSIRRLPTRAAAFVVE